MNPAGNESAPPASSMETPPLVAERIKPPSTSDQSKREKEDFKQEPINEDITSVGQDLYYGGSQWPIFVG